MTEIYAHAVLLLIPSFRMHIRDKGLAAYNVVLVLSTIYYIDIAAEWKAI